MKIGFGLPQCGSFAEPKALLSIASRAEEIGYNSLWTFERLLFPVEPRTPYPASPDGKLPEQCRKVLDPIEALTFVAATTDSVRLGTSVLNLPFYNPVMLARRLTSLDVLSGGRLEVGLGLGWSIDEFEAAGAEMKRRGQRADEFIEVLKAIWTQSPASFKGEFYSLAPSHIELKPVQKPHPPIYLAAYAPGSMRRVAEKADGWNPAGLPLTALGSMWDGIQKMAEAAGRKPPSMTARGNLVVTPEDLPEEGRHPFVGSLAQIGRDAAAHKDVGVTELVLDLQFSPGIDTLPAMLEAMQALWEAVS